MQDLTPVERSALLAMAASGGELKESADICKRLGLSFKKSHRDKLKKSGLIATTQPKPLTHALTDDGWDWVENEIHGQKPKGLMGLGGLYGVLNGLGQALERRQMTLREFVQCEQQETVAAPTQPSPTADATAVNGYQSRIADAAWARAESDLALACQDMATFAKMMARARAADESSANDDMSKSLRQIELSAEQVFQSIRRAAADRDLEVRHQREDKIAFDAAAYESDMPVAQGEPAMVLKPAVFRSESDAIIARGIAQPC